MKNYGIKLKAANLNGKQVITSEAHVLGEVEGVDIDLSNWSVTHLQISLLKNNVEKFNYKKPIFGSVSVCLPIQFIKVVGDVISISQSMEDLKYLPEFKIQE
jgi:sporulation protein YlmC with PRC-barrel domain